VFERWGRVVVRWRRWVLAAGLALLAVGATWGSGVFDSLTGGGFDDPASESSRAQERIDAELGSQATHLLVLYSSPTATVDQAGFAGPVTAAVARLRASPEVAEVTSWYDTPAPGLVSTDRHATYLAVRLASEQDEDALLDAYRRVSPLLPAPGVNTQVGGLVAFIEQSNAQTERDVVRAELLSFPVLLVLLILIFRGMVAAAAPLLVGAIAILGAFVSTRLLALATEVSIFAINIITVIGLAMAIDYALFVVSRFREELPAAPTTTAAITRTLATAGRTVLVSGTTIVLALASLLIFPQAFLRSMALGGMSAVGIAMLASLTVLPALLAVLGPRINALRVPLPWRRRGGARVAAPEAGTGEGAWAGLARSVMRRPAVYVVGVVVVLLVLASPVLRLQFGGFDERVLPEDAQARVVDERIATEFPDGGTDPITVLVSGAPPAQARGFAGQVAAVPGVTEVAVTAGQGRSTVISAGYPGEPTGSETWQTVRRIRELPAPEGAEVLVGGRTAADLDLVDSLRDGLPRMALLMAATIMVLLFLAFGSVVLPVKAVVMNVVSIGAAFGVVVWGFQDGHLAGLLGFTSTGAVEPSMLVLMFALLFGLSTDYEVFLLSRVREEWDRTGDNTVSVAQGLQRTGRIITAAALLLIVVVAGFATGEMSFVKLLGVGMIVAIAVDATLVRALLVPATMRLLGRWNWWAPGPLAAVYRRYGIREGADPEEPVAARTTGR
jgi:RND superfamily putative drug exporter